MGDNGIRIFLTLLMIIVYLGVGFTFLVLGNNHCLTETEKLSININDCNKYNCNDCGEYQCGFYMGAGMWFIFMGIAIIILMVCIWDGVL